MKKDILAGTGKDPLTVHCMENIMKIDSSE